MCGSSPLIGAERYPPQVLVKGIILNDSMSSCWGKETQKAFVSFCHLGHWGVKLRWERRRESIAWLVREVFHPGACCPLANPQSPSSPFQHGTIQKGERQNCVRTFAPDRRKTAARTVHDRSLNNALQYSLSSSLPVCVCVPVLAH